MNKYRDVVYMVLDELKVQSDDAEFTEEHIIFLLNKYRALLLKQKYSDVKKQIPESNYQTICLDLEEVSTMEDLPCIGEVYVRSKVKIPNLIPIGNPTVYTLDYYRGDITFIDRTRMKYVGYNKYLQNIIYCSLGADNYLYFKSSNPQFRYLEKVRFNGVFEDSAQASELSCDNKDNATCDTLDMDFCLEDSLIPVAIQLIVKELTVAKITPADEANNAKDNLPDTNNTTQQQ